MIKQMNYKTFGLFALILLLASCSGWKKASETTLKTSSTNVNVDTGPIKVRGDDNSSSITFLGKEIKSRKKKEQFFPENPKQFINGDICKYCDYIGRTENEQGNLIEAEMANGFKNGEEREYCNEKIIRSSYYADGRRSGMEYYFSEGKIVDSAYAETIFGSEWNIYKANAALPDPIAKYISREYFQDKALGLYAFLLGNEKISQIARYNEVETDIAEKGTFTPIIKIFYDSHQDFSNFKVVFIKPFHEEMIFKNNELVERKKIKGDKTVLEFRQGEFFKEFYDNGTAKKLIMGDVTSMPEENTEQCRSMCQTQWFYENGVKRKDYFFVDGQLKQGKEWSEKGIVVLEIEKNKSQRTYYDNGKLKEEYEGDVHMEDNLVVMQNGTYKNWHSNGVLKTNLVRKEGIDVSQQIWDSTAFQTYDYERNKYLKTMEKTIPVKRTEIIGGVISKDGDLTFTGNIVEKGFRGNTLEYEYNKEGYNPTSNTFKNVLEYEYDSTGTKTKERVYQNNKILSRKIWARQDSLKTEYYLRTDYNANSYLKFYNEPKKISLEFKGKSEWPNDDPEYIDGTLTSYKANGKKEYLLIFKNGLVKSGKLWNENGILTIDFDTEKYAKFLSGETKKFTRYFKGTSRCDIENWQIIYTDGTLQEFDEAGKLVKTKTIKNGSIVDETEAKP